MMDRESVKNRWADDNEQQESTWTWTELAMMMSLGALEIDLDKI